MSARERAGRHDTMTGRTPLGRVLGLGSTQDGAGAWLAQRVTSVALVPLGLWFAFALARLPDFAYATVAAWAAEPLTTVGLLLLLAVTAYHARLGVQVIIEDYVHGAFKIPALLAVTFAVYAAAAAGVFAVLRISFGAAP